MLLPLNLQLAAKHLNKATGYFIMCAPQFAAGQNDVKSRVRLPLYCQHVLCIIGLILSVY